ncbi:hypothetical protein HOH45_03755, partial [bacterium]|nr:hypothetical protein [bacterium]
VPLDPDDINRRMVDIGKQMFIVANKPTLDADNFTKVVAQLRDLQVLIQTKILEVDNLKLGSAKQRATVERIRPEIERLMGLNQTKIGDMLTKFMLLPKMIGDGKDSEKIDELVRQIQDSSFHLRTNDSEATRPSGSGVRADSPVRGPSLETTSAEMLSEDRQFFGTVKDMTSMFDEAMNATHSKTRKKTLSKLSTSFRIALLSQREDKLNAFMEMMKEEDVKTHHGALKRMDGLLEKATLFSAQFVDKFGTVKSENLRKIEEKLSGMGLKNFEVYDYVDRSISGTIELAINSWSTGMFGSKKEPRVYILKIPTPAMVESGVTELNFVRHIGASENEKSAIKTLVKGTGLLNPTVFSKGYEDLKMDISGMKKTKATLTLKTEAELDAENELAVASPERGRSDDNGIEIISLDGFMGVNQFTFSDVTACNALFNSPSSLPDVLTVFNMPFEGTSLDDFPKIVEEGDQKYEITATQESEQAPIQLVIKEQDRSAGDTVLREQKITCFTSETEISDVDDQVAEQFINRMTNSSYASNLRAAFQADYETQTVSSHVKTFLAEHIVGSKSTITLTPFETQIAKKIIKMPELLAKLKPEAIQIKMSDNIDKTMDLFDDVAIADLSSVLDTISPEEVSDLNKLKDFASSTSVFNELIENSVQMLNTSSGSALNRSFDKAFEQFSKTKNQLKLVAEKMCKDTLKTVINDDPVFFSESLDKMLSEIEKKLNTEFLVKVTLELIKKMPELDCDDVVSPDKLDEKVESHIYDLKNRTEVAKKINKRSMELLGVVQLNKKEFNLGITGPLALQLGEIDGAHTDIVLDDSSELNVKTFKLSSLIHQRVLQVASDLNMYLFSSLKEGGVKLSSNISMDKVLTHKILHEQTSSDKFKEKLASLKSSKSYLSALPDSYKLVGIGYSDFAEGSLKESLVTDIRILTDSGEETLITFEPEEPYDKKILRSLTTILSKEEKKKPAVIAYEKKQLKASIVEKYLGMETGSLRGKKIEIKEPVFSHSTYSSSKMVGVSISIQGRSTASNLFFDKVSDEDASLKTDFLGLWKEGKKELIEEVKGLTQSNTRAELFEETPVSQELKESYLENHNRLLNIDIESAVNDIFSGKKQASVDAINRGIKHDAIVSRTDPINLTDVAKADKDSCAARVDEAKKEYDTSYTQKVKEFNGEPHRRAKAQEILNKIIGNSDIKIERVSVDDSGKITDIFIKKRDRKDVVSYKTINRVKSALKQSPFKNDLDGFLDEINRQVSDLVTDETTRFKEDASLPVTVAEVSSAVNSLIADTSLDMFDIKPAVEGKPTEDEISKMFEALESVKATIFKPINDILNRLPDGLQGVIPKEEIESFSSPRDTYEIKKALEKMPASYQVMFKRLTGLRVMVDRELNKLDESYNLEYRTMPDGTEFETENFLAGLVSPDEGHSKNDHLL